MTDSMKPINPYGVDRLKNCDKHYRVEGFLLYWGAFTYKQPSDEFSEYFIYRDVGDYYLTKGLV